MTAVLGEHGDDGFLLLGALVMIFLVLLALSVAAPRIAKSLKREKEVESARRANQYVRGIRMYYKKFGHYPSSVEQLEKTNNQRFLRQQYVDPLTGKADWRLIHLGENQTKVKGFFGEELQGMQAGLGSLSGSQSGGTGAGTSGTGSGTGTTGTGAGSGGTNVSAPGAGGATSGINGAGTAPAGRAGASGGLDGAAATAAAGQSGGFPTGTGGVIIGIGSSASGESIVDVNEQSTYETWEFLYDPRIEQLYAKGNLLGGGSAGSSAGNGLGSLSGSQSNGTGAGATPGTGTTTGTGTGATGTGIGGTRTPP